MVFNSLMWISKADSYSSALIVWILCYAKNSLWCFRPFPEPTLLERHRRRGAVLFRKKRKMEKIKKKKKERGERVHFSHCISFFVFSTFRVKCLYVSHLSKRKIKKNASTSACSRGIHYNFTRPRTALAAFAQTQPNPSPRLRLCCLVFYTFAAQQQVFGYRLRML